MKLSHSFVWKEILWLLCPWGVSNSGEWVLIYWKPDLSIFPEILELNKSCSIWALKKHFYAPSIPQERIGGVINTLGDTYFQLSGEAFWSQLLYEVGQTGGIRQLSNKKWRQQQQQQQQVTALGSANVWLMCSRLRPEVGQQSWLLQKQSQTCHHCSSPTNMCNRDAAQIGGAVQLQVSQEICTIWLAPLTQHSPTNGNWVIPGE